MIIEPDSLIHSDSVVNKTNEIETVPMHNSNGEGNTNETQLTEYALDPVSHELIEVVKVVQKKKENKNIKNRRV